MSKKLVFILLAVLVFTGLSAYGFAEERKATESTPDMNTVVATVATPDNVATTDPAADPDAPVAAPAKPSPKSDKPAAKPIPLFEFGWDQRVRNENWNNIQDLNSARDDEKWWTTFRQRLWFKAPVGTPNVEFYVRFLSQFTKTSIPATRLNLDEVIFDNLYVDFKKTFIPGVSLKVGRQDIMRGEGFILMDGSSGDGPRTMYMNAIDLAYTHKKYKFEVLGILDPRQDDMLPIIHNQHKNLTEFDESAIGLYFTDRNRKNTDVDAYYFLKRETNDFRPKTSAAYTPDRHINTLGGRVSQRLTHGVSVTGEFAYQWGAQHANPVTGAAAADISAFGGYGYVKKEFKARFKPYVIGGYWVLSGDDPSTGNKYEGWDPLFARWPKWSGMYVWSMVPEKGVAYWTNSRMFQAEAGFSPWKPVTLKAAVYVDNAFHPYPYNPNVFGPGTGRGTIPQIMAFYKFSDNINGEFRYEILAPGDFYSGPSKGQFFRFEINYSWKKAVGKLK